MPHHCVLDRIIFNFGGVFLVFLSSRVLSDSESATSDDEPEVRVHFGKEKPVLFLGCLPVDVRFATHITDNFLIALWILFDENN